MESSAQGAGASGEQATSDTPSAGAVGPSPAAAQADSHGDAFAERPELFVGAAFAGGLVLAQLLKRVGR
jgi:hypothetical protein